ncbi:TIGR01244 family sulfur transferase [Phaeovulum sp.]|uniref:TIGR01244 family sulfur transferase n=1 Tax=Phaeovulum sp. TaxID=2934796 RepID=UPI00356307C0
MELRPIVPGFAVAPQIEPEDMADLAALGYRTVINNRPDSEVDPYFAHEAMAKAAAAAGLAYHRLPFFPGEMTAELIDGFSAALDTAEAPVLAYCRSGTRSSFLWALSEARHRPLAEIIALGAAAGYDFTDLIDELREQGAR